MLYKAKKEASDEELNRIKEIFKEINNSDQIINNVLKWSKNTNRRLLDETDSPYLYSSIKSAKLAYELLKQKQYSAMDVYDQVLQLFTARHRFIKSVPVEKIAKYEEKLLSYMHMHHQDLIDDIKEHKSISKEVEEALKKAMETYTNDFLSE